jgi:ribosomal-protein-alanine N-acetyltransferase
MSGTIQGGKTMTTPAIETPRVLLRPLTVADAETIFENWASDAEVTKYLRWSTHRSVSDTIEWLTIEEGNIEQDDSYDWGFVYKESGELFGSGGLVFNEEQKLYEIGYAIMKSYWGRGLTTEIAKAKVDFGVNTLGAIALYGRHAKDNPASGRVMEKAGFVYRGDGVYTSFDGKRTFPCREYVLSMPSM